MLLYTGSGVLARRGWLEQVDASELALEAAVHCTRAEEVNSSDPFIPLVVSLGSECELALLTGHVLLLPEPCSNEEIGGGEWALGWDHVVDVLENDSAERVADAHALLLAVEVLELALSEDHVACFYILARLLALLGEQPPLDHLLPCSH